MTSLDSLEWLTTKQVATTLQMSEEYVARQCAAGHLVATKLGTTWRIAPADLKAFMSAGQAAPPARVRVGRTARQRRRSV